MIKINYLNDVFDNEVKTINVEKLLTLCDKLFPARKASRALSSLPAEVKAIAQTELEGKEMVSAEDICRTIGKIKEAQVKGLIGRETFHEGKNKLKNLLPVVYPMTQFTGTNRKPREDEPQSQETGLAMMDFDGLDRSPREVYTDIMATFRRLSLDHLVYLAHITPGGEGLRFVFAKPYGMTIVEALDWFSEIADMEYDHACKDKTRLSFVVPRSYVLCFKPDELAKFTPEMAPHALSAKEALRLLGRKTKAAKALPAPLPAPPLSAATPAPLAVPTGEQEDWMGDEPDFEAYIHAVIGKWMQLTLNGRQAPAEGERNDTICKLGADLHKRFHLSLDKMMKLVDGYGLTDKEKREALKSGMRYEASPYSDAMLRAVKAVASETDNRSLLGKLFPIYADMPPRMPARLPRLLEILVDGQDTNRPIVAMAVFPSLAAHLKNVMFVYHIDGNISVHHATLMHVTVGPSGSGKSCVDTILEVIIADIIEADDEGWDKEDVWREDKGKVSKNAKQPERPKSVIRRISSNITKAELYNLAKHADGYLLYNSVTELDELDKMADNKRQNLYKMLRVNDDLKAFGGQLRYGADAAMTKKKPELTINASTTPAMCLSFFTPELFRGCTSRWTFAEMPEEENGARVGKSGNLRGLRDRIRPYIDRLNACKDTVVAPCVDDVVDDTLAGMPVAECPQLGEWTQRIYERYRTMAADTDDAAVDNFSRRAVKQGFLRAAILVVANGMKWEDEIGEFFEWSVDYDMWCKYRLFGSKYNAMKEAERKLLSTPKTLSQAQKSAVVFSRLSGDVTVEAVNRQYIQAGMTPPKDTAALLRQWVKRGKAMRTEEPGVFRILPKVKKARTTK